MKSSWPAGLSKSKIPFYSLLPSTILSANWYKLAFLETNTENQRFVYRGLLGSAMRKIVKGEKWKQQWAEVGGWNVIQLQVMICKLWNWDDSLEFSSNKETLRYLWCHANFWLKASPQKRYKFGRNMFLSVKSKHWRRTQLLALSTNIYRIFGNEYFDYEERPG